VPKSTVEMQQQVTFEDWNFATVWYITENNGYPQLRWELLIP
jgi:hypothetical protein